MRRFPHFRVRPSRRCPVLAAAAAGTVVVLGLGLPSRAQQNLPAVSLTAPASATGGANARVSLTFAVPAGIHLQRNPAIVVTDPQGRLFEFHPALITPGSPASSGYRDLPTELYPPGVYHVYAQIDYTAPDGTSHTLVSPLTTLTVPAR